MTYTAVKRQNWHHDNYYYYYAVIIVNNNNNNNHDNDYGAVIMPKMREFIRFI